MADAEASEHNEKRYLQNFENRIQKLVKRKGERHDSQRELKGEINSKEESRDRQRSEETEDK
jgi:hypothetical protein